MQIEEFRRVLAAFADKPADVDARKGDLLIQVNDEIIQARISLDEGQLVVVEGGETMSAERWIVRRIARLPVLADRILDGLSEVEHFVPPTGRLLDHLDEPRGSDDVQVSDAADTLLEVLDRRVAGATSVLYLTSDAGEGKTTLIGSVARRQAQAYKDKRTNWLLVPIPLGGRNFLRFDDVVAAVLVNRFRYRQVFYEGFLELVRLGVVVPAFDGFEEMFVEGSSGEAVSALGGLIKSLRDSGTVLVAARKAFFEYQSFSTQTRLFDALGGATAHVTFARLQLERWNRVQFVGYAERRRVIGADDVYQRVAERLGRADHPMLTRAVLVRRLIDVVKETGTLQSLLTRIGRAPEDYFYQFVSALVEREANEKWLDKGSETSRPLLSVAQHHELLGQVAYEMWAASVDSLKGDMLDAVADLYSHERQLSASVARQVRERLRQHSLLIAVGAGSSGFAFDHEDYRQFYLGEALGPMLKRGSRQELARVLQVAQLDARTTDHAAGSLQRADGDGSAALKVLLDLAAREPPTSFARENAGSLALSIVHRFKVSKFVLTGLTFPTDALRRRNAAAIEFVDCHFFPTFLPLDTVTDCHFLRCRIERLDLRSDIRGSGTIEECEIGSVFFSDRDEQLFSPLEIRQALNHVGLLAPEKAKPAAPDIGRPADAEIRLAESAFRAFLRANHVNENVLRQRLGTRFSAFESIVLPALLESGVVEQVQYLGAGSQRRFRLAIPMKVIEQGLMVSSGSFADFVKTVGSKR